MPYIPSAPQITTPGGGSETGMLVGHVFVEGSTGVQSYSIGVEPKAIIFSSSRVGSVDVFAGDCIAMLGATSGLGERWCYFSEGRPGEAWVNRFSDNCVIRLGTDAIADVVSFDADGFHLDWTAVGASTAIPIHYAVFYGDGLTAAKAATLTIPSAGATVSFSGVGGTPTGLVMGWTRDSAINSDDPNGYEGIGYTDGVNNAVCWNVHRGSTAADQYHAQLNDACGFGTGITGGQDWKMALQSFDADGATFAISDNPGADILSFGYLALCGPRFDVGTITQGTSDGDQATTGIGFPVKGVLFSTVMALSSASITTPAKMMFGAFDGVNSASAGRGANTSLDDDFRVMSFNLCAFTSSTVAYTGQGFGTSLDADGFTVFWGTVDGNAYEYVYFAMGDGAGGTGLNVLPKIRTRGGGTW